MSEPLPNLERVEAGRVGAGRTYEYLGLRRGGRLYVVRGFCRHAQHGDCHTGQYQELVLYQGLDGRDRGVQWVCTLSDFCLRFREVTREAPPPAPVVGKTIDLTGLDGP